MKSEKILEMINAGQIKELKEKLADEIYTENLKEKPNARKRYAAMKRFYKYVPAGVPEWCMAPKKDAVRTILQEEVHENCFCSRYGVVFTTEDIGTIKNFDMLYPNKTYPDVNRFIANVDGDIDTVSIEEILAKAKSRGYKYSKKEILAEKPTYFWNYRDAYYSIGLLDQLYSIIADGIPATLHYVSSKSMLTIATTIGTCGILPVRMTEEVKANKVIIRWKEE